MRDIEERVKTIMADVFVCQIEDINENTKKEDLDNWDSLQHLIFASKLESEFDVKFTPEEINSMTNFQLINSIVKRKL